MYTKRSGFTIVELVVVIVIIGVLTAISIVVYRGIQERARTVVVNNAVQSWSEIIQISRVNKSQLPGGFYCLGKASDFPAENGFAAGECYQELRNGSKVNSYFHNSEAEALLTASNGSLPNGLLPVTTNTESASYQMRARGVVYEQIGDALRFLLYVPQVRGECGAGETLTAPPSGNGTDISGGWCALQFND